MSGSGKAVTAEDVQNKIDSDLRNKAEDAGVDVGTVVQNTIANNGDYGVNTVVRFAESALNRQIEAASAEVVSGILAGSRDRYGKNWPRRYALVRSNGDHIEASSWKGSISTSDGGETEIPSAAAVDIRLDYDSEYDSYEAKQLDNVTKLSKADLAGKIGQIAKHPSEIGRDDEYEMVVVKGTVGYINPQTVFEDGEPKGDGPIMLEDERGRPKPHFELVLSEEADTRLRAHVERQRYSEPMMAVEDFGKLCKDAYQKFDSPDDQTQFVGDAMRGREVAIIGNVNSVDQNRSNGNVTKYIDVGVAGIVELNVDENDDAPVQTETVDETPDETPDDPSDADDGGDEDEEVSNYDGEGNLRDFEDVDPASESESESEDDADSGADIDSIAADVEQYANLVGMDKSEITVEVIEENTAIEAPDSVIEAAIGRIGGGPSGDESESESDDAGDEPDDPIEALRNGETGQLECPKGDCFGNASNQAGLFGHVMGTHIPGDEDPEQWVLDQIEG